MKPATSNLSAARPFLGAGAGNPLTGDNDFTLVSEGGEIEQGRGYHCEITSPCGCYDERLKMVVRAARKLSITEYRDNYQPAPGMVWGSSLNQGRENDRQFIKTGNSSQHVDAAQVAAIKAPRLRVIPRSNQSFGSVAQRSVLEYDAINRLRLLNRSSPSGKITGLNSLKKVTLGE